MPIRPEDLPRQLARGLAPVYLIAGDEALFVEEALDAVRAAARAAGYSEREILDADAGFDWGRLGEAAANLSLFGDKRLIELRMPGGKPGTAGAKALQLYCQQPSADTVLLIACGPLDGSQRKSAWIKAIDDNGVFLYAWPLPLAQFGSWLQARLARNGVSADADAVELLVERSEGNLLSAAQEVEKLSLLYPQQRLTLEQMRAAVADTARYSVFDLADALIDGELERGVRILTALREEGVEPILVLWSLAKDLRALVALQALSAARRSPDFAFWRSVGIFQNRQQKITAAARRAAPGAFEPLLLRCAQLDRLVKGLGEGRPWDELLRLTASFARAARGR